MSSSVDCKLKMNSTNKILEKRGLDKKGKVQQIIDSEVLRRCEPYVPLDSGMLVNSGTLHTEIGSGTVKYQTPYARPQYYGNKSRTGRGGLWFERMKIDHKEDILKMAAECSGGEAKT